MKNILYLALITAIAVVMQSCKSQEEIDDEIIQTYLSDHGIEAEKTPEGVYYYIEKEGTGDYPKSTDKVKIDYIGTVLETGYVFDSSYYRDEPPVLDLSTTILGWQYGIPHFREGSKGYLFIPSQLAYGMNPPYMSGIPVNAVLLFQIELHEIVEDIYGKK